MGAGLAGFLGRILPVLVGLLTFCAFYSSFENMSLDFIWACFICSGLFPLLCDVVYIAVCLLECIHTALFFMGTLYKSLVRLAKVRHMLFDGFLYC